MWHWSAPYHWTYICASVLWIKLFHRCENISAGVTLFHSRRALHCFAVWTCFSYIFWHIISNINTIRKRRVCSAKLNSDQHFHIHLSVCQCIYNNISQNQPLTHNQIKVKLQLIKIKTFFGRARFGVISSSCSGTCIDSNQ